ncbi:MAG: hypothetical protein F9K32_12085 [Desulfobulbaceae bacterium]|nr:MAG: hypothetical protein F9K32_12085 [Desulfobulbaceae bacterium]
MAMYSGREKTIADGPFAGIGMPVAGCAIIQVQSREEAVAWSRRFPDPAVDGGQSATGQVAAAEKRCSNPERLTRWP